VISSK